MKKNKINFETIFYVALIVLNIFVSVLSLFSGEYLHTIMYMAMAVMWLLALSKDMEIKYLRKVVDLQRQCAQENEKALMSMWNCCAENAWISVDDKLPEPNVYVNIRFANGQYAASYIRKGTGAWAFNLKPTHWKPINKDKS